MPRRIFVTGNAGSGKTTLAKQLGELLQLPVYGLDRIVWQPGWKKTPPDERKRLELELAERESWVIEGVSTRIQKQAELVIFLDVPRRVSLWRCAKRNLPYLLRSRPELPEDCLEIRILPKLLKIIWNFPEKVRPLILSVKSTNPMYRGLIHVQSQSEWKELLHSFHA